MNSDTVLFFYSCTLSKFVFSYSQSMMLLMGLKADWLKVLFYFLLICMFCLCFALALARRKNSRLPSTGQWNFPRRSPPSSLLYFTLQYIYTFFFLLYFLYKIYIFRWKLYLQYIFYIYVYIFFFLIFIVLIVCILYFL